MVPPADTTERHECRPQSLDAGCSVFSLGGDIYSLGHSFYMVTGPNAQVYGCTWTDSNCKWYMSFRYNYNEAFFFTIFACYASRSRCDSLQQSRLGGLWQRETEWI